MRGAKRTSFTCQLRCEPIFRNLYGRRIAVRQLAPGVCELVLGESPVYFSGAELADGACLGVSAAEH